MSEPNQPDQLPMVKLMQCITGHWVAAAVYATAKLSFADHLADGPKSSEELAQQTNAHAPSVYRLLRALAGLGLFNEIEPDRFSLTEAGELLRSDHPHSMRSMVLFQGAPPHWQAWGSFQHAVKTGESTYETVHGMGFFDYCKTDPKFSEDFNSAMTGMTATASQAVLDAYDFTGIGKLIDVGGGHGYLISSILQKYPEMTGAVLDLPHVVEGATEAIEAKGLTNRLEMIGGDFFEPHPAADAFLSKHIIHDWGDEQAVTILTNMRNSLNEQGRVLLIESVLKSENRDPLGALMDLEMLNSTHGGRERTEAEFAELFSQADLKLNRIIETKSPFSVIEALPV